MCVPSLVLEVNDLCFKGVATSFTMDGHLFKIEQNIKYELSNEAVFEVKDIEPDVSKVASIYITEILHYNIRI